MTGTPALVLVALVAFGVRLAWLRGRIGNFATGEAYNVAEALALGRGFADAYHAGQGPTAHLQPVSPSLAGAVYAVLGVHTSGAEWLLGLWSIGLVVGSFLLLFRVFASLHTPRRARLAALAFLAVFPMYLWLEVVTFRIWDGALTVFLVALFLERLYAADRDDGGVSTRALLVLAVIAALTFFTNPVMGTGCYAAAAMFCRKRLTWGRTVAAGAIATGVLALVLVPWTIRNATVMHVATPLRDNAGLELAISMYPEAVRSPDEMQSFLKRICAVHPTEYKQCRSIGIPVPDPYRAMIAAGGEHAYADRLGAATRRWMMAHPADVVRLMIRHWRQTYLPPAWAFVVLANPAHGVGVRSTVAQMIGALGLLELLLALVQRRRGWGYLALVMLVPGVEMSLFQPVVRYDYLFYAMLTFCAADAIALVATLVRRRAGAVSGRNVRPRLA